VSRCAALLLPLAATLACGGAPHAEPAPARAVLTIDCPLADAAVYVDDVWIGEVADLSAGLALPPGPHRLELRRDHYHTRYLELSLAAGERTTLRVVLSEALE
jgi:hypothetical protein